MMPMVLLETNDIIRHNTFLHHKRLLKNSMYDQWLQDHVYNEGNPDYCGYYCLMHSTGHIPSTHDHSVDLQWKCSIRQPRPETASIVGKSHSYQS